MKNIYRILLCLPVFLIFISLCGCTAFLAGIGTIGVGMDTFRLERNVEYDQAWEATLQTLEEMDINIESQDKDHGLIEAVRDPSKIKIQFYYADSEPTAIDVSVRKKGLPYLKLADEIAEAINAKFSAKRKVTQDA